ncbi:eukaryotic translation initiation factor 4G isoform X2 [Gastrolobium bilobum]|uniref:eukaryotic translation initiation factor 4G isoform X2 n=1 Tax=Gastrolobium bilobum TaxID=150636 RepID=UPI002AB304F8|nr:eukaryotic translation initiation factor 4G isoform X2 [Gastrolobium bilobum]
MSVNQSKSDKSDAVYRKSGRSSSFNQQRGSYGRGGGGGGGGPAPSSTSASSLSTSRSFNKRSNNAQGGQSRVNPSQVNTNESNIASSARTNQNGTRVQPQSHGTSDGPVTKPSESSATQRSARVVPKAPTSQLPPMRSDSAAPTSPAKDASKAFPFQFGSIIPGLMNGMAIPARTSSAPPNIDEQKRDQARHDSYKSVPSVPTPVPKQQQPPRNDAGVTEQSNARETHIGTKAKKDPQLSTLTPASQMQKPSVVPVTGISMATAYHQSQASLQFAGPNPQIQSQGVSTTSLQVPIPVPFPIGNAAHVQQPVFVPGLQPLPMHPQGIMHQGQNMSFTSQMGHQLSNQLGNMGIGISPQYPQQQGGKFAGPRKTTTVKITHPETHEELRLDNRADAYSDGGSSGARSHLNIPSPSQPVKSFAPSHPMNYYPPSSYNTNSLYFPASSSLPLTSSQITPNSQPPIFNYPANHGPQNVGFMNSQSLGSLPVNKTIIPGIVEPPIPEHSNDVPNVKSTGTLGVASVTIRPSGVSAVVDPLLSNPGISGGQNKESPSSAPSCDASSSVPQKGAETCSEIPSQQSKLPSDSLVLSSLSKQSATVTAEKLTATPLMMPSSAVSEDSVSVVSNNEGRRIESLRSSSSLKDNQKKPGKKGQSQHEVSLQSPTVANMPSRAVDCGIPDTGVSEPVGGKTNHSEAINTEDLPTCDTIPSSISSGIEVKTNCYAEVSACVSAERSCGEAADNLKNHRHDKLDESSEGKLLRCYDKYDEPNIKSGGTEFKQTEKDAANVNAEVLNLKAVQKEQDESATCIAECDITDLKSADPPETTSKYVMDNSENAGDDSVSLSVSGTNDRPILEPNKMKTTSKGRKKRKEILQKADAAGSTSDLYNAYKGPDEKKEAVLSSESSESASTSGSLKHLPADAAQPDAITSEDCGQSKAEPDDWEDAADMSTPKLVVADKSQQVSDGDGGTAKKYSRDFLLKFAEQYTDLPEGFEIVAEVTEALMSTSINSSHVIERDTQPSPGRNLDRAGGMSRIDRRGNGVTEEDRWNKVSNAFYSGRGLDGIGGNAGFRSGQGGNFGVLRNPRLQTPVQYAGGILSGPMQSVGNQGGMQRNSPDGERWQRASSFQQRGLIPSPTPQTPLQSMHKAEKKYEVGKAADVEEVKQRQLKAILNKLTPQNFDRLFEQVKAVNIDNAVTLTGVISQIFEKALMEPTFCEMYANFCLHLASELPDFSEDNEKITFKRLLLNKCQEEFERGEREQEEANKVDEGEVKQSNEEREQRRVKARRRMLGNIRLIGELYKKRMLTERIMHECIKKLLGQYQDPDEEDIEALCKLMSTIGEMIDHPKAKVHIDAYFERMKLLSNNMNLSSRVRFMLKDAIDLRKNKWQQRRKVEGPKKIEEVHRDAAHERQAQAGRLGRGPGNNQSARRNPMDFGPRGSSMLSSPNSQMGGLRGLPNQVRGYGGYQDARFEERQSYEARTLSVPLPQRSLGDDSITLGPQGGLARGMSIRGSTAISNLPISDVLSVPGDSHRMTTGLNGYSNTSERLPYNSRDDLASRYITDRFSGSAAYDQSSAPERNINYGNRDLRNSDRNLDRSVATSPPAQLQGSIVSQNASSEKVWPEERLRDMSMSAIREYYSARDEKEVALCVRDLNSPSYHPSMVSLWVTDSFEKKDIERDLLAKLLVNLVKSQDGTLTQAQLIKGFESVLSTLEDAVNDAPRAAEFLGRIFAKVVTESVVTLNDIGKLIHDGGEEPGSLLEAGLAGDVLGSILEVIKSEKGDVILNEIRSSSNLRLETFRPPNPMTSRKLENFI